MSTTTPTEREVYDVISEITRYGERIKEAIDAYQRIGTEIADRLRDDDPTRGAWTYSNLEDPARLLNDMTAWCKLAQALGVPDELICQARRGEYVAHYAVRAVSERRIEPDHDDEFAAR